MTPVNGARHSYGMPTTDPPTRLTPTQAAHYIGVTPSTLNRWADAGRIPTTKTLGGHRRYTRDDLDQLAAELREPLPPKGDA